ncbi:hypothetical protein ACN94_21410 [Gordonia paraffinivorans]|uniref:helix-turn-helix transcriptional regulator n=1 Tax=Gordonia paraffinivorans TaxID=175628 RepID=UPI001C92C2BF|nr:LuxR C-terminal-related transcriptional regulator [Gordonia paraffinivorans]MBY4576100.1 hypothetical protein [Gordonia paraffinivorans]
MGSATIESYRRCIAELTDQLPAQFRDDLQHQLTGLHQEWQLGVTQDWEMNSRVTRDMDDAALGLSGLEQTEYFEQIPRSVGEVCGFQKVLFSVVQGTHWIPVSMWAKDPTEITAIRLNDYLKDNPVIRLVGSLPEAEMARHRRPVLIENALDDPRTFKPPVVVSNATDYAGAPRFVDGRIAAFLHIDRAIQSRPPNETDMLWLNRYSTSVAAMYRIQRSTKKERHLRSEMARISALLDDSADPGAPAILGLGEPPWRNLAEFGGSVELRPRAMPSLSAREYEVLEQLSSGLTNQAIAAQLCVSIHTVRTHVRQILKKMNVSHRAAAVAAFNAMRREHRDD